MRILVTGANGFLGSRIVQLIADAGDTPIAYSRRHMNVSYPNETAVVTGDICDRENVFAALNNVDAVIHVAAKVGDWGSFKDFFNTNVVGTRNIIDGCKENGVKKLVFCSTPSIVFTGAPIRNGNESLPYAKRTLSHYQRTKMEAERNVLAANEPGQLMTSALRPHAIWGPGERHTLPRILTAARQGKLRIVGDGQNRISMTHVDDAAIAHLQAIDSEKVGGKAYFVNDLQPVHLWKWYLEILERVGLSQPKSSLRFASAYRLAHVLECVHGFLPFLGAPRITRYSACLLAKDHFFDTKQAQIDFGFQPNSNLERDFEKMIESICRAS